MEGSNGEIIKKAGEVVNFCYDKNTGKKGGYKEMKRLLEEFKQELQKNSFPEIDKYDQIALYNLAKKIFLKTIKEGL
jgi:hypothetical protein